MTLSHTNFSQTYTRERRHHRSAHVKDGATVSTYNVLIEHYIKYADDQSVQYSKALARITAPPSLPYLKAPESYGSTEIVSWQAAFHTTC